MFYIVYTSIPTMQELSSTACVLVSGLVLNLYTTYGVYVACPGHVTTAAALYMRQD